MIKKHGKYYRLDLWLGKRRVRRSLRTDERAVALDRARELERELRVPKPPGLLLNEFLPRYKEWAKQTKPASYRTEKYRLAILENSLTAAGISTLNEITPWHVEQFRSSVMDKPVGQTDRRVGRATANRYLALLRTMFNKAVDWGMFSGPNPVSRVKFYREGKKVRPLTEKEAGAVLDAARQIAADPRSPAQAAIADLIIIMFNTGLRRAEALGLRWRDYTGTEVSVRGKGDRTRIVPLNEVARAAIDRQPREGIYILPIPNRFQQDNLRRTVKRIRKLSGVEHFHLHLCRHYAMTAMLAAGVDILTAAEVLGHSRLTTSLLYAHTTPERRRQAVEAIRTGTEDRHRTSDVSARNGAND